jgi:hypothetical protein
VKTQPKKNYPARKFNLTDSGDTVFSKRDHAGCFLLSIQEYNLRPHNLLFVFTNQNSFLTRSLSRTRCRKKDDVYYFA